jgi:hypothetical protein
VEEAETAAEMELLRSAGYGHMIMRLRDSDPTDEARRADPFGGAVQVVFKSCIQLNHSLEAPVFQTLSL